MRLMCVFITVLAIAPVAQADTKIRGHMTPLETERLPTSIRLTKKCASVEIVEWKPTPGLPATSYSPRAVQVMDELCKNAFNHFAKFVKRHGYSLTNEGATSSKYVSLLPAMIDRFGEDYRNLNDVNFRFFERSKEYDQYGRPYAIWGYFERQTAHMYMRNDVFEDDGVTLNKEFSTVFSHELFHALSYASGIFHQHKGNEDQIEESLAVKFTVSLGLGK